MQQPVIEPYNPLWNEQFKSIKSELQTIPFFKDATIQHIGSTSVAGLEAKNVIDIQASINDVSQAAIAANDLRALGYTHVPDLTDHVPAGTHDDPALWVKQFWFRTEPGPRVNLHIRQIGRPNQRLALLFRDYLRCHKRMSDAYAATKKILAVSLTDVSTYSEVKDPVIDIIMAAAENWATATNWKPPHD